MSEEGKLHLCLDFKDRTVLYAFRSVPSGNYVMQMYDSNKPYKLYLFGYAAYSANSVLIPPRLLSDWQTMHVGATSEDRAINIFKWSIERKTLVDE